MSHADEIAAALAEHQAQEVAELRPSGHDDPLGVLFRESTAKPGCPGVRVDREGREWYSAGWVSLHSVPAAPERPPFRHSVRLVL